MKVLNAMYDQMFEIVWHAIADPIDQLAIEYDVAISMTISEAANGQVYTNVWNINNAAA
jgi:hypothetical protein